MTRLPGAIFVVDTLNEKISVQEAQKLKIPIFAMVDTTLILMMLILLFLQTMMLQNLLKKF